MRGWLRCGRRCRHRRCRPTSAHGICLATLVSAIVGVATEGARVPEAIAARHPLAVAFQPPVCEDMRWAEVSPRLPDLAVLAGRRLAHPVGDTASVRAHVLSAVVLTMREPGAVTVTCMHDAALRRQLRLQRQLRGHVRLRRQLRRRLRRLLRLQRRRRRELRRIDRSAPRTEGLALVPVRLCVRARVGAPVGPFDARATLVPRASRLASRTARHHLALQRCCRHRSVQPGLQEHGLVAGVAVRR
mmetsp:Transcript_106525/g.308264  ORF Transcript_106525/g.308264 Transcript_106525/m.308264 type:complete len:245 (+) Transcript_106525:146-880(+)